MNFKVKKIISVILLGTVVFSLSACRESKNTVKDSANVIGKTASENKQILENIIESTDNELDNILSIDNVENYNKVGNINEEELFAFNHISYLNLLKRFEGRISASVLENELYIRGFRIVSNNIVFSTNSDFLAKQKLYLNEFNYFTEIFEEDYIENFPDTEKLVEDIKNQGYQNLKYFKTLYTTLESAVEKDKTKEYEVFYVLGEKENSYKILDAIYIINGRMHYEQFKPHLSLDFISNFKPNNFGIINEEVDVEDNNIEDNNEKLEIIE